MCQDSSEGKEPIIQNLGKDSSRFKEEQVQRPWGRKKLDLSKQQKEASGAESNRDKGGKVGRGWTTWALVALVGSLHFIA